VSIAGLARAIVNGVRTMFGGSRADRDVRDEVGDYLARATAAHEARGLSPEDARRAAQREMGNVTQVEERVQLARWESIVASFGTDVRYALRMLRRSPVFTIVVVVVISIGTGAVTTIFSGVNAFLLRPLPGTTDPDRLVGIDRIEPSGKGGAQASYGYYTWLRDRSRSFTGIAAWGKVDLTISTDGAGNAVYGNLVTGNFFSVLGVRPALGRFFVSAEDSTPLTHPVIVVSYDFWQTRLGADSAAAGRVVGVNGHPFTIIGVAPRDFHGVFSPIIASAWVPIMMQPQVSPQRSLTSVTASWLWSFGRLKEGVTRETARSELIALTEARIAEKIEPASVTANSSVRLISLTGLPDDAQKAMASFTGALLAAAFLVLLIASVNVAAMLSARAIARQHEMAIRAALGAARSRVIRQLLTESLVLFSLGAGGGIAIAYGATAALERIPLPDAVPLTLELTPDARVLAFALVVALTTGVIFGLAPALRVARQDVQARLRDNNARGGTRRTVVSNVLVVAQLALSVTLLVSAGLLLRALSAGRAIDPRFDMEGVVTATFKADSWGYNETRGRAFFAALRGRLAALPGVTEVAYTGRLPLQMGSSNGLIELPGDQPLGDGQSNGGTRVQTDNVDDGYFDALRIPIVAGRSINRADIAGSARVAVVNETLARAGWPDGNAVGSTFGTRNGRVTVVGVARDSRYADLTEATPKVVYYAMDQGWFASRSLVVRTNGGTAPLGQAIQSAVRALDPALPLPTVVTLREATSLVLLPQRVAAMITGAMGALGLLLAGVGLYGIIAYSVNRRSREIGVRMALGASAVDVRSMIVREGVRLAGIGVGLGLVLAATTSRLIRSWLFGVSPLDIPTFAAIAVMFVAVAALASWLPARRAAAANPVAVLRIE